MRQVRIILSCLIFAILLSARASTVSMAQDEGWVAANGTYVGTIVL